MAFEHFYQAGVECFTWGLPKVLVRQAFAAAKTSWGSSRPIHRWQVRAFFEGVRGRRNGGAVERLAPIGYAWPTPPDLSWSLVVCAYADGEIDLDLVHEVSRRFWTEDHGFFESPGPAGYLTRAWYRRMGFDVLDMSPQMLVVESRSTPHLVLAK